MQGVILFFSLGLIFQTLVLAYTSRWIRPISIALVISLFLFVFFTFQERGSADKTSIPIIIALISYLSICAFLYRDWMIKKISEFSIIIITMTLLYSLLRLIEFNLLQIRILDIFILVLFVLCLVFLILRIYMGNKAKIILYSWFLIASSLIILFQLRSISYIFHENQIFSVGGQISVIFAGMISFYIISNFIYILMLMPFSDKEQSRQIAEEHVFKIKQSIVGNNLAPRFALLVILVLALVFLINLQFKIISDLVLINFMIIFSLYYPSSKFIPEITEENF